MSARCTYEWIIPFTQHQATAWDQNTSYGLYLYCFRSISDNYSMYILYYIIMFMHAVFGVENHRNPFKYSPWIFSESRSRKNRSCMFSQQISDEGVYLHWYLLQGRKKERERDHNDVCMRSYQPFCWSRNRVFLSINLQ